MNKPWRQYMRNERYCSRVPVLVLIRWINQPLNHVHHPTRLQLHCRHSSRPHFCFFKVFTSSEKFANLFTFYSLVGDKIWTDESVHIKKRREHHHDLCLPLLNHIRNLPVAMSLPA